MIYDCLFYFNGRSRKGSDHVEKTDYPHRPCISIRAPARGATTDWRQSGWRQKYFNPRSHEGSDVLTRTIYLYFPEFQSTLPRGERPFPVTNQSRLTLFQSTLPRGERHKRPLFFVCEANFNPRSHEGSDQTLSSVRCSPQISIHAPTRGATVGIIDRKEILYFNPRSHEGSDMVPVSSLVCRW